MEISSMESQSQTHTQIHAKKNPEKCVFRKLIMENT